MGETRRARFVVMEPPPRRAARPLRRIVEHPCPTSMYVLTALLALTLAGASWIVMDFSCSGSSLVFAYVTDTARNSLPRRGDSRVRARARSGSGRRQGPYRPMLRNWTRGTSPRRRRNLPPLRQYPRRERRPRGARSAGDLAGSLEAHRRHPVRSAFTLARPHAGPPETPLQLSSTRIRMPLVQVAGIVVARIRKRSAMELLFPSVIFQRRRPR